MSKLHVESGLVRISAGMVGFLLNSLSLTVLRRCNDGLQISYRAGRGQGIERQRVTVQVLAANHKLAGVTNLLSRSHTCMLLRRR
jgi:hypothetical protein